MNKKKYLIFLTALLAVVLTAGCGKKNKDKEHTPAPVKEETIELFEQKDNYVFGFAGTDMEDPFFDIVKRAMEIEFADYEIELRTSAAGSDQDLQLEQINAFIEEGVDIVFLSPVDKELVKPGLEALDEAHIPVINIDSKVDDLSLVHSFVGSNNKELGKMCAEHLVAKLPEGGNVVILENFSSHAVNDRINGFEQELSKENFQVVGRRETTCDFEGGYEAMMSLYEACSEKNVKIDAVMCGNDNMALGAEKALEEIYNVKPKVVTEEEREKEALLLSEMTDEERAEVEALKYKNRVLVYGVNGSPEAKETLAKNGSFIVATAAQSPINIGMEAAEIALDIIKNKEYETEVTTPSYLIHNGNIVLYGTNGWQ